MLAVFRFVFGVFGLRLVVFRVCSGLFRFGQLCLGPAGRAGRWGRVWGCVRLCFGLCLGVFRLGLGCAWVVFGCVGLAFGCVWGVFRCVYLCFTHNGASGVWGSEHSDDARSRPGPREAVGCV